jgi:hypothetical protein
VLASPNLEGSAKPLEFHFDNPVVGANDYRIENVPPGFEMWYEGGGNRAEVSVTIAPSTVLDTGFRPSRHGWHFSNGRWPSVPNRKITLLPGITIPVGKASNGMCGGMTYGAIDYFIAGQPIPARTSNPPALGDPDFDFISQRLWDSFHLDDPLGASALHTYVAYMTCGPKDRARVTIKKALPVIRASIARQVPAALGLIGAGAGAGDVAAVCSNLGKNHQVAAYFYQRSGRIVTLGIYDCNMPNDDSVFIRIDADNLDRPDITHNTSMSELLAFFETSYRPASPR